MHSRKKKIPLRQDINIGKETARILEREGQSVKAIAGKLQVTERRVLQWLSNSDS